MMFHLFRVVSRRQTRGLEQVEQMERQKRQTSLVYINNTMPHDATSNRLACSCKVMFHLFHLFHTTINPTELAHS